MPDIRKSKDSEEGPQNKPGESDKKSKRESDRRKENQGDSSRKKPLSGFEQFRRLQQHNAELKTHSSQSDLGNASEQLKPHEPLGDTTNNLKTDSQEKPKSGLETQEVKETIKPNERQENIVPRAAYNRNNPLSLDLMHEIQYKRQEIPKPPSSDTHKDKGQN